MKEKSKPLAKPGWYTPNEVVWSDGKTELLEFRKGPSPILIVAPEAGHSSHIMDYGPGQSLVRCAMDNSGYGVYGVNKLGAKPEHKDLGIEYCFDQVRNAMSNLPEQQVHLVGLCQGGWSAAVAAARNPGWVKSLTLAAAPIDFHAGNGFIKKMVDTLPPWYFQYLVNANGGLMPGALILSGFLAASCLQNTANELKFMANVDDDKAKDRARRFSNWYYSTQALPGRQYLEIVEMFRNNSPLEYGDLSLIKCPVNLVTGTKDDLTPPIQTLAMKKFCPQAVTYSIDAGHIGIFMSNQGLTDVWSKIFKGVEC